MLSRMLEQQGLFLGKTKGKAENNESKFFRTLNNWLFQQAGAHWDNPDPWQLWLANDLAREASVNFVRGLLGTPRAISYLGFWGYLRYRSPASWPRPWGWKDPLNTFTLPVWLHLYPQARVIHIYRNGVDVAGSLRRRSVKQLQEFDAWSSACAGGSPFKNGRCPAKFCPCAVLPWRAASRCGRPTWKKRHGRRRPCPPHSSWPFATRTFCLIRRDTPRPSVNSPACRSTRQP